MNKNEFIREFAALEGVNANSASKTINNVLHVVSNAMTSGTEISIRGLGKIVPTTKPKRRIYSIHTKKMYVKPAFKTFRFRPSEKMIIEINK